MNADSKKEGRPLLQEIIPRRPGVRRGKEGRPPSERARRILCEAKGRLRGKGRKDRCERRKNLRAVKSGGAGLQRSYLHAGVN